MSLRSFMKKKPDKKAIFEEEDDDFRKPKASKKGNVAKKSSTDKPIRRRGKRLLDSDSEEEAPKAKKPKLASYKSPQKKKSSPAGASRKSAIKSVSTPTSAAGRSSSKSTPISAAGRSSSKSTPTSAAGRSSSKATPRPVVTLLDFFGSKPIQRVNHPQQKEVETIPESPVGVEDALEEFDEIAMAVPEDDMAAGGGKELSTHEDADFTKTLQETDTSSLSGSQPPFKKMKLVVDKVDGTPSLLSVSSVSHISDSPPSLLPEPDELDSAITPTKRSLRPSTLRQAGYGTPQKEGGSLWKVATPKKWTTSSVKTVTPRKTRTPKKTKSPVKSAVTPKKGTSVSVEKLVTPNKKSTTKKPMKQVTPKKPIVVFTEKAATPKKAESPVKATTPSKPAAVSPVKATTPSKPAAVSPVKAVSSVKTTTSEKTVVVSPVKTPVKVDLSIPISAHLPAPATSKELPLSSPHPVTPNRAVRSVTPKITPRLVPKVAKSLSPVTPEERKAQRTDSFIRYLNRSGPKHPGSKEMPTGAENCLEGLTFVITGVLESLEREEASELVKNYGGKVTGNVSGRTSYLVVGEEAGESKQQKAIKFGTKIIEEDGLLELISTRPSPANKGGIKKGNAKKKPLSMLTKSSSSVQPRIIPKLEPASSSSVPESGGHDAVPDGSDVADSVLEKSVSRTLADRKPGHLLWVDKYKPTSTKQLVGQKGESSKAAKLAKWLRNWSKNRSDSKSKDAGAKFKAALLSGPPGVGKTTTAQLVCKEEGYSYVEMNASSCRNKSALRGEVAGQLSSFSITCFLAKEGGEGSELKKHAVIMDEVDGMDGNADRGGVSELISLIKSSQIPVICICNDHQSSKMRSLTNHCYQLHFTHPKVEQIRGAMMSICFKEGIKINPTTLSEVIVVSGQDMRQVLHNLSLWSATDEPDAGVKVGVAKGMATHKLKLNSPFEVVKRVFEPFDGEREFSLQEKSELFFTDYNMAALFVQENYPKARPRHASNNVHVLRALALAADSLSQGDTVERLIRRDSRWELLPCQSFLSSVIPGEHCKGMLGGRPMFPRWLGANSATNSNDRALQDLHQRTQTTACCNKTELGLDYIPFIFPRLTAPLVTKNSDGISDVMDVMDAYKLKRDDWDTVQKLGQFSSRPDRTAGISSKVKSAFTRAWSKRDPRTKETSK